MHLATGRAAAGLGALELHWQRLIPWFEFPVQADADQPTTASNATDHAGCRQTWNYDCLPRGVTAVWVAPQDTMPPRAQVM